MGVADSSDRITIHLTSDEALVLFDWLHRCEERDRWVQPEHRAKQVALWNLSALLERELVQPFDHDYVRSVEAAQLRLGDDSGSRASTLRGRSAYRQRLP